MHECMHLAAKAHQSTGVAIDVSNSRNSQNSILADRAPELSPSLSPRFAAPRCGEKALGVPFPKNVLARGIVNHMDLRLLFINVGPSFISRAPPNIKAFREKKVEDVQNWRKPTSLEQDSVVHSRGKLAQSV